MVAFSAAGLPLLSLPVGSGRSDGSSWTTGYDRRFNQAGLTPGVRQTANRSSRRRDCILLTQMPLSRGRPDATPTAKHPIGTSQIRCPIFVN